MNSLDPRLVRTVGGRLWAAVLVVWAAAFRLCLPGGMGREEERPDPEKIVKELKKAAQKRDKKLKKALDEGQYARWKMIEKDLLEPFLFVPEQGKPGKPEPGV